MFNFSSPQKIRQQLIGVAESCVGKPFKFGSTSKEAPNTFDCSSLSQYLYKSVGIEIPRSSIEQAHHGKKISLQAKKNVLQIGDILFFHGTIGHYNREFPEGIGHVAIYLGNAWCIQATGAQGKVAKIQLDEILKRTDLVVIKRLL